MKAADVLRCEQCASEGLRKATSRCDQCKKSSETAAIGSVEGPELRYTKSLKPLALKPLPKHLKRQTSDVLSVGPTASVAPNSNTELFFFSSGAVGDEGVGGGSHVASI